MPLEVLTAKESLVLRVLTQCGLKVGTSFSKEHTAFIFIVFV
jgi:hypothetical protein